MLLAHDGDPAGAPGIRGRDVPLPRDAWLELVRARVSAGAHVRIRIHGASMMPALPRGALVLVGPLSSERPAVGDVVLALLPSGLPVLHRVVRVGDDRLHLQADAMPRRDPPIPLSAVLAKVMAVRVGQHDHPVPKPARWRRLRYWGAMLKRFVRARAHSFHFDW